MVTKTLKIWWRVKKKNKSLKLLYIEQMINKYKINEDEKIKIRNMCIRKNKRHMLQKYMHKGAVKHSVIIKTILT